MPLLSQQDLFQSSFWIQFKSLKVQTLEILFQIFQVSKNFKIWIKLESTAQFTIWTSSKDPLFIVYSLFFNLADLNWPEEQSPLLDIYVLNQWFPTFWVLSPGILFYKQFWSHVAPKLSEIYHFGNFFGPAWTFFKPRWLGTSVLNHHSCFFSEKNFVAIDRIIRW